MVLDMRVVVVVVDHVVMVVVVDLADRAAIAVHAVDHFGVLPVPGIRRLRRSAFPTRGRSTVWLTLGTEGMYLGLGPGWTQQLRVQVSSFPVAMSVHELVSLADTLGLPTLMLVEIRQTHVLLVAKMVIVIYLVLPDEIVHSKL